MSNRLFDWGRDGFSNGLLAWVAHVQKAMLVDLTVNGTDTRQINAASNANPVVYQTTVNHGYVVGDVVCVGGIVGNLSANQLGQIDTVPAANQFTMKTLEGIPIQGSAAYVSGGYAVNLTQGKFVADVNAGREGTDATIPGTSTSRGVCTSSNWSWLGVALGNDIQAAIIYDANPGADATNRVEAFIDGKIRVIMDAAAIAGATSLIVEPLRGPLPNGTVLSFSDGHTATLTVAGALGDRVLTVAALAAGGVAVGSTAEATTTAAGFPATPTGGNITFTVGTLYGPGGSVTPGFTVAGVFEL